MCGWKFTSVNRKSNIFELFCHGGSEVLNKSIPSLCSLQHGTHIRCSTREQVPCVVWIFRIVDIRNIIDNVQCIWVTVRGFIAARGRGRARRTDKNPSYSHQKWQDEKHRPSDQFYLIHGTVDGYFLEQQWIQISMADHICIDENWFGQN